MLTIGASLFFLVVLSGSWVRAVDYDGEWEHDIYGGHSSEFRTIHDEVDWDNLLPAEVRTRRAAAVTPAPSGLPTDAEIDKYLKSYRKTFEILKASLEKLLAHERVAMTYRLKSADSLKGKLMRKNYTLNQIHDAVGFRLTLATVSEVRRVVDLMKNDTTDFYIAEVKCYGVCRGEQAPFRPDGYRRVHFLLKINSTEGWAELQMGTPYATLWADWSHESLYKGKFADTTDLSVSHYGLDVGRYFYELDDRRDRMPNCPTQLRDTVAKDTLPADAYLTLKEPPNLCFHWPDIFDADKTDPESNPLKSSSPTLLPSGSLLLMAAVLAAITIK